MGIANFPFPSFTLALSSERVVIPGPSYVIRIAPLVIASPADGNPDNDLGEGGYSLANDSAIASAAGHSILDMMRSTSTYDRSGGQEKARSGTARLCFKNISKRLFVN